MKSAHVTLLIVLSVSMVLINGCTAKETHSNTSAKAVTPSVSNANATDNSNHSAPAANSNPVPATNSNRNAGVTSNSTASASATPKDPPQLIGTYESREVLSEGVVTVISKLKTMWVFHSDGNYSRVSQVNGKTYHSDSGKFRLEAPDRLVLTIEVTGQKAKRKIQTPPVEKTHKYSLSPDGDELRLTSEKGAVGTFQRVQKPNPS